VRPLLLAGLLLLLCACNREPRTLQAHGVILDLKAVSITRSESLVLRSDDGTTYTFNTTLIDPTGGFDASHLRQHMAFGQPVTIYYEQRDSALVATRITD
jgi:hypothetical protein